MQTNNAPALAPVWDYLRGTIRGRRVNGALDHRFGGVLEEYVGHLGRLVRDHEITLRDGLVLAAAAVDMSGRLPPLPEARRVPRTGGAS